MPWLGRMPTIAFGYPGREAGRHPMRYSQTCVTSAVVADRRREREDESTRRMRELLTLLHEQPVPSARYRQEPPDACPGAAAVSC